MTRNTKEPTMATHNPYPTVAASPTRLRCGDWGALVASDAVKAGDVVTITTRAGKSWEARVERVVWAGTGKFGPTKGQPVAIVATSALSRFHPASRDAERREAARAAASRPQPRIVPKGWRPCGYPGCGPSHCDDCSDRAAVG